MGAFVDFLQYLNELEAPIVVGRDYKSDRLFDAFKNWALGRNVSLESIDRKAWLEACEKGI